MEAPSTVFVMHSRMVRQQLLCSTVPHSLEGECHLCSDCWVVAAFLPGMQVEKLSALLGVVGTEYTCETAGYFWLLHVLSRWV